MGGCDLTEADGTEHLVLVGQVPPLFDSTVLGQAAYPLEGLLVLLSFVLVPLSIVVGVPVGQQGGVVRDLFPEFAFLLELRADGQHGFGGLILLGIEESFGFDL